MDTLHLNDVASVPKGHLKVFARQVDSVVEELVVDEDNLIVTAGKTFTRDKLSGEDTTNYISAFAFGTGNTAPDIADTDLETPVYYSGTDYYKALQEYTNATATKVTFIGWVSALEPVTQSVDLKECGLFTAAGATGGSMYCRATFDAITKNNTIELRLEYSQEF